MGLLGYRVGYNSAMYSVYLRRDGTLPMTGDLNMGGQSINNAKDITASGDVNAVSFNGSYGRFAKNVSVSEDLMVTGFSTFGKNVTISSYLTVKNGVDSDSYVAAKTNSSRLQIGGGGSSNQNAVLINVAGGAGDGYLSLNGDNKSSVKLDVWGSQKIRGDLALSASNDGKTTGAISATGNITASGTVSGQYFQPTSTSVAGTACVSNGLISKNNEGLILSCQNGMWRNAFNTLEVYYSPDGGNAAWMGQNLGQHNFCALRSISIPVIADRSGGTQCSLSQDTDGNWLLKQTSGYSIVVCRAVCF